MKHLILDGYNLLYRARHSMFHKSGSHSIVYAFFRSLRPLIEKMDPDVISFVLEGHPKWRYDLLPEYKGQRKRDDKDNFREQKRRIISLIREYFPINVMRHPDYECDDVIANLVWNKGDDEECVIVSSDTDFLQLSALQGVKIYNPIKKSYFDPVDFDYVAWKSLRGDGSDNIPGFKGIGDKRAMKLISTPSDLEKFLSVDGNRELFEKNMNLIGLREIPDFFSSTEKSYVRSNWDGLREQFTGMEFFSMVNDKSWKKFTDTFDNLECAQLTTMHG